MYPSCNIYQEDCICKDDYISETERSIRRRWDEYNNPTHDSKLLQHLENNLNHTFHWFILVEASSNKRTK